jgi:proteasome maturation protein
MRIVPTVAAQSASLTAKANSLGLHDTLKYGPLSIAAETKSRGGLENHLTHVRDHAFFPSIY